MTDRTHPEEFAFMRCCHGGSHDVSHLGGLHADQHTLSSWFDEVSCTLNDNRVIGVLA